jgi:hypothetical protein
MQRARLVNSDGLAPFSAGWCGLGGFGYNGFMPKPVVTLILAVTLVFCGTRMFAQPVPAEQIYRFDPILSVERSRPVTLSAGSPVMIEKNDGQASLRLQTEGPVAPYVGAERVPELSDEELRLLSGEGERGGLGNYRFEAGLGVRVEDKASLSLGYRFHDHPSLLDERRNDPLSLSGDVRISFDIKVPFD